MRLVAQPLVASDVAVAQDSRKEIQTRETIHSVHFAEHPCPGDDRGYRAGICGRRFASVGSDRPTRLLLLQRGADPQLADLYSCRVR